MQYTHLRHGACALIVFTLTAAAPGQGEGITSTALKPPAPAPGPTMFTQLDAAQTGIDFENRIDWDNPRKHLYMHSYAGGGVCIGDYDNDGRPDLYLTSQIGRDRLYRQVGDMVFEDVTDQAGVNLGTAWGTGATFLDFDNDGDLDLYVCNYDAPNLLYVNQGNGTFIESAKKAGLDFRGASVMAAVADYDNDGFVDIYLLTNRMYPGAAADQPRMQRDAAGHTTLAPGQEEMFAEQMRRINGRDERYVIKAGQRDRLYHNNGDGTFTEVGEMAGISGNHPGLSATWWDYNNDSLPDLYVGNDFWDADRWYRNNGDGTFADAIEQAVPYTPWFSMGADFGDINNDGHMDFLAADMSARTHYMSKLWMGDMGDSRWFLLSAEPRQYMRNMLYLNTGSPRFMEIGFLAGLASTDWTWSVLFNDLDNDGLLDFFATNGTTNQSFDPDLTRKLQSLEAEMDRIGVRDPVQRWEAQWNVYRQVPPIREPNAALRNDGDYHFSDAGDQWGVNQETLSYGAAMADFDRDGDLDLVVCNVDEPVGIYRNDSNTGRRLLVSLRCTRDNRFGVGARIVLNGPNLHQVRQVFPAHGFQSATEPVAQFGLGERAMVAELTVIWPDGSQQTFERLEADRWYTITQSAQSARVASEPNVPPQFIALDASSGFTTDAAPEREFDEYETQPLLPALLSQNGPGMAWGDADGDGDDDCFIGAPAGQVGQLLLDDGNSHFTKAPDGPWADDRESEDMGVLWNDVDSDGDLDLVVASGSVEWPQGDPALRDRLYLNDGRGRFTHAPAGALSDVATSTSCIVAADYDRDGDVDLFVGGRTVPDQYPLAPPSRLLRNDGGTFTDVTQTDAPGLADSGMVTSAVWSDANDDGFIDLLIACEYGPIHYWQNAGGQLVERTKEAGLAELTGWWNSITPGDFDGDGDMDYLVLNAGLNTKYKSPAPDKPAMIYYSDFDANGQYDIVEAKSGSDHVLLPVRGLSCSSEAMPLVKQRMPTYHDFAGATLEQIYTPDSLEQAHVLTANTLASGVLVNGGTPGDGAAAFTFQPLPRIAQASPGYGAAMADFGGDGTPDVYFVQNFSHREPETGRWTGGIGQFLLGAWECRFMANPTDDRGLFVPGDGRAATVCDINHDGQPDIALTQNGGPIRAFINNSAALGVAGEMLVITLKGKPGNPAAVGSRIRLYGAGNVSSQSAEITAGSGYLSQSAAQVYFGLGLPPTDSLQFQVRWPDGSRKDYEIRPGQFRITIEQP